MTPTMTGVCDTLTGTLEVNMAYDKDQYELRLKHLRDCLRDLTEAVDGMDFEHGDGGVSSRARTYYNAFSQALDNAKVEQFKMSMIIHEAMEG